MSIEANASGGLSFTMRGGCDVVSEVGEDVERKRMGNGGDYPE